MLKELGPLKNGAVKRTTGEFFQRPGCVSFLGEMESSTEPRASARDFLPVHGEGRGGVFQLAPKLTNTPSALSFAI